MQLADVPRPLKIRPIAGVHVVLQTPTLILAGMVYGLLRERGFPLHPSSTSPAPLAAASRFVPHPRFQIPAHLQLLHQAYKRYHTAVLRHRLSFFQNLKNLSPLTPLPNHLFVSLVPTAVTIQSLIFLALRPPYQTPRQTLLRRNRSTSHLHNRQSLCHRPCRQGKETASHAAQSHQSAVNLALLEAIRVLQLALDRQVRRCHTDGAREPSSGELVKFLRDHKPLLLLLFPTSPL